MNGAPKSENPWLVESIQSFWYLKCPECVFDTQEEFIFQDHAMKNHTSSFALFGAEVKEEKIDNSYDYDNQDYSENYDDHFTDQGDFSYPLLPPPEVQIKEEEGRDNKMKCK